MRKFILKIGLFFALFTGSVFLLIGFDRLVIGNQYLGSYQAALLDKAERLRTIKQPKIILVGNSNVAFGIDSEKIEDAFGMPVVNLGLHGDLGNAFHENIAKLAIMEGDIVVVCHSDYADDGKIKDPVLAWAALEWHQDLWEVVDSNNYFDMIKAYPKYALRAICLWITGSGNQTLPDTCYSRGAFNEYGDIVYRNDRNYKFLESDVDVLEISDICIDRLNEFNQYCSERGATMIVAGHPIGYGEYTLPQEAYEKWEAKLRARLNCDVISSYTDYFFPYQYFYNHYLHLTETGARMRTEQLIRDLSNWERHNIDVCN